MSFGELKQIIYNWNVCATVKATSYISFVNKVMCTLNIHVPYQIQEFVATNYTVMMILFTETVIPRLYGLNVQRSAVIGGLCNIGSLTYYV